VLGPAACVALALGFVFAPWTSPAHAIYGPGAGGLGAELISAYYEPSGQGGEQRGEQANGETADAAISSDGRYVVFQTKATNLFEYDGESESERVLAEPAGTIREGGIFRYDRQTRQLELVAGGNLLVSEGTEKGKLLVSGAANPSVSAGGRYVAFSSAERLAPGGGPGEPTEHSATEHEADVQVFVRDMEKPPSAPGAYRIVSSPTGREEPAIFVAPHSPVSSGNAGAQVWPNTSISANGRYVLFRTEAESDIRDVNSVTTPAGQLFVRDSEDQTTTLISRREDTEAPAESPPGHSGPALGPASISGDGSTVAWVSADAPQQTRFIGAERATLEEPYYLWRRWQQPDATTRRITGIADLDDQECTTERQLEFVLSETATGPCYGPLTEPESRAASIADSTPALSADGYTVAFLASSGLRPTDLAKPNRLDVFVTSMSPGVSRKAGTSELTLAANGSGGRSLGSVESLALSADGSTIAFTSTRDLFVLSEPAPVGTFSPQPTLSELYVIHLGAQTLERALLGYGGGEPDGPVEAGPTLTANGETVAFVGGAPNLFYGDAHSAGFRDAFTASLQGPAGTAALPAGSNATPSPFALAGVASADLGVRTKRGRAKEAVVLVETPGPGTITATATGRVATITRASRTRSKPKPKRPAVLARATATAPAEGTTTVVLHLRGQYAKDLAHAHHLAANVVVDFSPRVGGEPLSSEAPVTFYALPQRAGKRASV
jgi:Tol biopolymer transport system component